MWSSHRSPASDDRSLALRHEYEWNTGRGQSVMVRGASGEDLALTLDLTDGASSDDRVTALMMLCVSDSRRTPITGTDIDALVLGDRNLILAELVRTAFGNEVDLRQRCSNPECGAELEWPTHMSDLLADTGSTSPPVEELAVDDRKVRVRPATVDDQRKIRHSADPLATLVELCVDPPGVVSADDDEAMKQIEAVLEELDPLATIEFTFGCYACDQPLRSALDLPGLLLDLIRADDIRRSDDHHLLASGYGWSPADLLALRPADRVRFAATLVDLWEG